MLRDGNYLREPKPVIGRAYQRDTRYIRMTSGAEMIQRSVMRDYARRDTFWGHKEDSPFELAILAIIAPIAVVVLMFLPEMMR
jgi:hypothetical protein